jgi:hypothetical protein
MREKFIRLILLCTVYDNVATVQELARLHSQQSILKNPCEICSKKRGIADVHCEIFGFLFSTFYQTSVIFCAQPLAVLQILQGRTLHIWNS